MDSTHDDIRQVFSNLYRGVRAQGRVSKKVSKFPTRTVSKLDNLTHKKTNEQKSILLSNYLQSKNSPIQENNLTGTFQEVLMDLKLLTFSSPNLIRKPVIEYGMNVTLRKHNYDASKSFSHCPN